MTIESISRADKEVTVTLSCTELVEICNYIYSVAKGEKIDKRLYAQFMYARDFSQYGHIDSFTFGSISKCYEEVNDGKQK